MKPVLKKATKKDYDSYLRNLKDAIIVLEDTKKKIMEDDSGSISRDSGNSCSGAADKKIYADRSENERI